MRKIIFILCCITMLSCTHYPSDGELKRHIDYCMQHKMYPVISRSIYTGRIHSITCVPLYLARKLEKQEVIDEYIKLLNKYKNK